MTVEEQARIGSQLANPQHVYIELTPGKLFCHTPCEELAQHLHRKPIRFTQIAAEKIVADLQRNWHCPEARIVPLDYKPPVKSVKRKPKR